MELTIECQKRPDGSKPNALRRSGRIPAVLYGHNGTESVSITVDAKAAGFLVRDASLNNTLIQVNIPELPWNGKALLREIQSHPWRNDIYHLSFFSVATHGSIDVTVPLNYVGESKGVKLGGGTLDVEKTELSVRCAPDSIPETIEINISGLGVGDSLHIHELELPKGVTVLEEPNQVIVTVLGVASTVAADEDATETATETEE
jgi:large subunit ribosomal protein L25